MGAPVRLQMQPLAAFERDGLRAALIKAGLPVDNLGEPHVQCWRFETYNDVPVGFGALEIHGADALLRSVVTIPPVRRIGMGRAIVAALEAEARCRNAARSICSRRARWGSFGGSAMRNASAARSRQRSALLRNSSRSARQPRPQWSSASASARSAREHDEVGADAGLRTKALIGDDEGCSRRGQRGNAVDRLLRNGDAIERRGG